MFSFDATQHTYDIGGTVFGGQPGEHPTVLIGSIFYKEDSLVTDMEAGEIDREGALEYINAAKEMGEDVGTPLVVDVMGTSPQAMERFVEFVGTETDLPFLIDGLQPEIRLAGARRATELGIGDRAIYNSINTETEEDELEAAKELDVPTAMVMLNNTTNPTVDGRMEIVDTQIQKAKDGGFDQILLDTVTLDIIEPGIASKAAYLIKDEYGYPCGFSPTHVVSKRWQKADEFSDVEYAATKSSIGTAPQLLGTDFSMYNIKEREIIPSMAAVDALIAYANQQYYGIKPASDSHPLYNVFS